MSARAAILALATVAALATAGCNLHSFFGDPRCYTTADCSSGQICASSLCVDPGTLGTGRKCWATRDCQAGQNCQLVSDESPDGGATLDAGGSANGTDSQRCLPAGSGVVGAGCVTSLDCMAGLACDVVSATSTAGTCTPGGDADYEQPCTKTTDCLAGLACATNGTCLPYTELTTGAPVAP